MYRMAPLCKKLLDFLEGPREDIRYSLFLLAQGQRVAGFEKPKTQALHLT